MSQPGEVPLRVGQVLAGKYRVERVIGAGGMGLVVSALHVHLDERVAIKLLLPEALANPDTVARFAREARAAVKIKSEHVARVTDVGTLEDGAPYMVMEYLDGQDLGDVLKTRGPLPVDEALDYVLQAIEAIGEAHSLGIVHRDLKPSNLFLTRRADGSSLVKVLDFGISKVTAGGAMSEAQMTRTSAVMGSPLYMAPEQMVSTRDVDPRADVWALGIVLYQLLTAASPFTGETMTELCARILQEPPPPLRAMRPDVAPALEAVVLRCLEKDRAHRFGNVAELALALAPFAAAQSRTSAERVSRLLGTRAAPAPAYGATAVAPAYATPAGYGTPSPYGTPMPAPAYPGQGSTQSSWGQTRGASGGSGARVALVAVVGALAIVAGAAVGIALLRMNSQASAQAASPPPAATTADATATQAPQQALEPLHAGGTAAAATTGHATPKPTDAPTATPKPTATATHAPPPAVTETAPPPPVHPPPEHTAAAPLPKPKPDIF